MQSGNIKLTARQGSLFNLLKMLSTVSSEAAAALAKDVQLLDNLATSCAESLSVIGALGEQTLPILLRMRYLDLSRRNDCLISPTV